jgi:hypothetical protein
MRAVNIDWDVSDYEGKEREEVLSELPEEIEIPDDMADEDEISDYLSDSTGFCHYGFELEED